MPPESVRPIDRLSTGQLTQIGVTIVAPAPYRGACSQSSSAAISSHVQM